MIEMKRMCERLVILRVVVRKSVLYVVIVYAPQAHALFNGEEGRVELSVEKSFNGNKNRYKFDFYGDLNGHMRAKALEFEEMHGGRGFGIRNFEGEMLLEFRETIKLIAIHTWFQNGDRQKDHIRVGR
jgi:hypothetical protein